MKISAKDRKTDAFPGHYKVKGYRGIAFYVYGYAKEWIADECPDDSEEGGEYVDNTERVLVIMVGDDHKIQVDVDDLEPLPEGEFCSECGQLGCGWGHG